MLSYVIVDEDGFAVALFPRYSEDLVPTTEKYKDFRRKFDEAVKNGTPPPPAFKVLSPSTLQQCPFPQASSLTISLYCHS